MKEILIVSKNKEDIDEAITILNQNIADAATVSMLQFIWYICKFTCMFVHAT